MFCVTTEVCNTLFYVTMRFHWNTSMNMLQESATISLFCSSVSIHPDSSKMYQDLKTRFWWTKMKKEIAAYVARCDTCCQVKAVHLKPAGLLQPLPVLGWKWEEINMDFIVGLPTTQKGNDSI